MLDAPETILSHHALLDLYDCDNRALLDDLEGIRDLFHRTARGLKCTIVNELFHRFTPQGVSGVVVIAESHLSVHTWPELGYAAIDLYTCGDPALIDLMPDMLVEALGAGRKEYHKLPRGHVDRPPDFRHQDRIRLSMKGLSDDQKWLTDQWADQILWTIAVDNIVLDVQSEYQRIQVVDTPHLGRILVLDGNIQCAETDEAGYHEMIVHTGLCRIGASSPRGGRKVLVIGGGDGGAAREALRHPDVVQVDLVDIDQAVIDACRDYMPRVWHHPDRTRKIEDDPRFSIHIRDGLEYLKERGAMAEADKYDLIVVDGSDPVGPGVALYTPAFYQAVYDALKDGGATCVQGGSFWYLPEVFTTVYTGLSDIFEHVAPFECFTAVYPGGVWNLQLGIKGPFDPDAVDDARVQKLGALHWYSTGRHRAAFSLPPIAERLLQKVPPPLEEVQEQLEKVSLTES